MKIISGSDINKQYVSKLNRQQNKVGKSSFAEMLSGAAKTQKASAPARTVPAGDSVSFSSVKDDKTFAAELASKITGEVKAGHSDKELAELRNRIATGNYDINPDAITEKILG